MPAASPSGSVWRAVAAATVAAGLGCAGLGSGDGAAQPAPAAPGDAEVSLSVVAGRPTDHTVTLQVVSGADAAVAAAWSLDGASWQPGPTVELRAGVGSPLLLDGLPVDAAVRYRLQVAGAVAATGTVHTQRRPGSTFVFGVQGDTHPERVGRMYDAALYRANLANVAAAHPDFYVLLGDDFSIEPLIRTGRASADTVQAVYDAHRSMLAQVGHSSAIYLVNGNHEQAAAYLLDGTESNPAVWAGRARNQAFALPAPDGFYTGDAEPVPGVGLLRDYYAWTWGDALFVVLDPYWHSPGPVDTDARAEAPDGGGGGDAVAGWGADGRGGRGPGGGGRPGGGGPPAGRGAGPGERPAADAHRAGGRDGWAATLGEAQYRWLAQTLSGSNARWKFVFAHHVNGTGRGGAAIADLYEWGGHDRNGADTFARHRPGWPEPIHALMARTGVTVFFQGHDHLYAREVRDGVIYQSVPNPADPTFQAFHADAYPGADVAPNSGHLRVSVGPDAVELAYIRAARPADPGPNGEVVRLERVTR